jgi:carbamoyltransferase
LPPSRTDIVDALKADDVASQRIGDIATPEGRDAVADLMASIVAQGGIIALYQGPAETGPRALGHRSILANPCDPTTRERLNERVKYREAIRPLAPMATLEAARKYFDLLEGAADADYNAYNYMVLTAQSKPQARETIPAVIHADGTGRIQIVRAQDDPLTYAYLKALGRHIGVEMSVNTSFNVAGPIAQTPQQAIETLRRSKGLDTVIMVAGDGEVTAAWHGGERDSGRFTAWLTVRHRGRGDALFHSRRQMVRRRGDYRHRAVATRNNAAGARTVVAMMPAALARITAVIDRASRSHDKLRVPVWVLAV